MADQVADHQEVGGEPHLVDDPQLVLGTRPVLLRYGAPGEPALFQTGEYLLAQPRLLRVPVGYREDRHPVPMGEDILGPTRRAHRSPASNRTPRYLRIPQLPHLLRGLEIVAVAVELEPRRIRQCLTGLHTQQRLMRRRVLTGHVVAVVGGQRFDAEFAADLQQPPSRTRDSISMPCSINSR